jgi:protein involved in polysaccharide export with SLBB domain
MLHRVRSLLAPAFLLLSLAIPLSAQDPGYALRPGDRITLDVFTAAGERVDVVSGVRILDREGRVFLPYVGTVLASGMDETGLRESLTERYGDFYDDPVVNVKVELRLNITGSVGRPGQYFLDPSATIVDALAEAGGATAEVAVNTIQIPADQSQVRLVRDGGTILLNVRPDEITTEVIQMRVHSGDWIHVPARQRSRIRDELTFWGSIVSFLSGVATLIVVATR